MPSHWYAFPEPETSEEPYRPDLDVELEGIGELLGLAGAVAEPSVHLLRGDPTEVIRVVYKGHLALRGDPTTPQSQNA